MASSVPNGFDAAQDGRITTLEAAQPAGDLVGTTDTQTLTNKTIDASANTVVVTTAQLDDVAEDAPKEHGEVLSYDSATTDYRNKNIVYNDVLGLIENPSGGGNDPPLYQEFIPNFWLYRMRANGDTQIQFTFHLNHEFVPELGFDFHVHLATNAAAETGTANFTADVWHAKLFNAATSTRAADQVFAVAPVTLAPINFTFAGATDQRRHVVVEVPCARAGPTASQIDSTTLDVDSIVKVRLFYNGATSTTAPANLFVIQADLHMPSYGRVGTRNAAPPFNP